MDRTTLTDIAPDAAVAIEDQLRGGLDKLHEELVRRTTGRTAGLLDRILEAHCRSEA